MNNKEIQEVMKTIQKVDTLPKNETIVVHTKTRLTGMQYERLIGALEHIREEGELGPVVVVPFEDMEIKQLTPRDKERLLRLLDIDLDGIEYVMELLKRALDGAPKMDYRDIAQVYSEISKAIGREDDYNTVEEPHALPILREVKGKMTPIWRTIEGGKATNQQDNKPTE